MRPLRLDVAGFTVFREHTVVDFSDVDFFVLVGPTGSGKSTLLDAICFALYGNVPRWADQRGVASALAPSSSQARVRLMFEAAGTKYVATRVVSRDGKGKVKTSLAGLQRLPDSVTPADLDDTDGWADAVLGEVLASAPKEMEAAVSQVLGLPYEHFVTCVVLPQGQFAQFLHARPSERGDILVNLLGLHVYRRIAERAGELARDATARAQAATRLIDSLPDTDQGTVDRAAARLATLRHLGAEIDEQAPSLAHAQETAADAQRRLTELDTAVDTLGAVRMPDEVTALSADVAAATEATQAADRDLATAETSEEQARTAAEATAEPTELRQVLRAHDQLTELAEQRERLAADVASWQSKLTTLGEQRRQAEEQLATAELAHAEAQRTELAGTLRPRLAVGDPCPVCTQEVHVLPEPVDATALRAAEKSLAAARTAKNTADTAVHETERELATATARLTDHDTRLTEAKAAVAAHGERASVADALRRSEELRTGWRAASTRVRAARQAATNARTAMRQAQTATTQAWAHLDRTRDGLASYQPRSLDRDALDTAWAQLLDWAKRTAAEHAQRRSGVEAAATAAEHTVEQLRDRLRDRLAESELTPPEPLDASSLTTTVAVAVAQAEAEHSRLTDQVAQLGAHRADRDTQATRARVAKALADHLRANNFERWLLEEALDTLVDGASRNLAELSGGQYELGHDNGEFFVTDHHDADLRRGVRTLSGGETFQASLALALALSEQLAGMSTGATALESIVLDEGFGTLDAATLETVAATLENLACRGDRVVGVVTHVPALAERIPVRFEVAKDTRTAYVQRAG